MARACADARHTNDTNPFPQTTLFVVSKSRLIASSARHSLVTEKKRTPHLGPPHLKVPDLLKRAKGGGGKREGEGGEGRALA